MDVISGFGTVYTWKEYPRTKDGTKPKPRWLIYLALDSNDSDYKELITTTTSQFYPNSLFLPSRDTPFAEDCYINFDEKPQPVSNKTIKKCTNDICCAGVLNSEYLKKIYEYIYKSNQYTQKQVVQLYENLISIGVKSISDPTKRKRRFGQIVIDK